MKKCAILRKVPTKNGENFSLLPTRKWRAQTLLSVEILLPKKSVIKVILSFTSNTHLMPFHGISYQKRSVVFDILAFFLFILLQMQYQQLIRLHQLQLHQVTGL